MVIALPILSTIVWLPILVGAVMYVWPQRYLPLIVTAFNAILIALVWHNFDPSVWNMQMVETYAWVPTLNLQYALGIDGISLLLVALTIFMNITVFIAAFTHVPAQQYNNYCATFLLMQGLMCGVFLALDALLFYVFFEAMMIPMFLIIGLWGGAHRIYATFKFILYTFFGSLLLLIAILYLHRISRQFAISGFYNLPLDLDIQKNLFWAMLIAFAVKIPMWPVHTWLPDAHTEAPTGGSVILAAITLKIGAYGMLRFLLPIVPGGCAYFATPVIVLSLVAITYIGLVAIVQKDMKRLIAYSSIAHMGFVTLGMFSAFQMLKDNATATMGVEGAIIQMISHGLVSGAMFLCVGVLYVRMHTRDIAEYGGVINSMPIFASFFMLFALANVGLPGTSGFVGEFLVILAAFKANIWYAFFAATTLVLGVSYTLWMYKRVMFGEIVNNHVAMLKDLAINEKIVFALLAVGVLVLGIYPNLLLQVMHQSTAHLVDQMLQLK